MTLPYRLKELRQQKNLTQAKVADSLGITQQSYARWENGKVTPTPEKLSKIAKFYGVTTDYLLEGQKDDIDLSDVEVLFRMTSDGLTEEEKVIFRDELIEFMKERKKLIKSKKKTHKANQDWQNSKTQIKSTIKTKGPLLHISPKKGHSWISQ